jgi:hypothetical protein
MNFWVKTYSDIFKKIKKKVNIFWTVSVDYMLKNVIKSFDKKLEDINLWNIK